MGKEALEGRLYLMEKDDDYIPEPTPLNLLKLEDDERAVLIEVFMPSIRLEMDNSAVKKTLTIPAWLNAKAMEKKVNFSQLLQQALKEKLGL